MVSLEKAVIARIERGGKRFEILVDPELAQDFRQGKPVGLESILAVRAVFKDARKGERAGEKELEEAFGTQDLLKIAEEILRKGEVQLTVEQRRRQMEQRRRQIADILAREAVNPQTGLPHPVTRILNAMEEARVQIDPFKPADQQLEPVIQAISSVLPISLKRVRIAIKVPMEYAGRVSAQIRGMVTIRKEEWKGDGWYAVIELPAGMQAEIMAKLNRLSGGQLESRVLD
ncbi:MAG: ribosome assembly factor SBDS [Candidatus Aenigmatarchaeota archaeon]|nr:MAG: ribosome assembly factor SBDS [Candidatus Aenigmarchaeota archaeon]